MADGANPAPDTRLSGNNFISQSLDLDMDGNSEISRAATKADITAVFNQIGKVIKMTTIYLCTSLITEIPMTKLPNRI